MRLNKKAISPVIATVLLITIAIVVIVIIFIWARGALKEETTKFEEPISRACDDLNIEITLNGDTLNVVNRGDRVALHSLALKTNSGDLFTCGSIDLSPNQGTNLAVLSCESATSSEIASIIPIVKSDDGQSYNCENNEITSF